MTSMRGREMHSFLPAYYENSRIMNTDMNTKGTEMDLLFGSLDEILQQFFVQSATWGLERWEYELGIETNLLKPIEQRRSVVESKLRGSGKFSGRLVKNVAEAYDGGTVDVSFQPQEWSFTIHFIDTLGIPPNLDDLKAVIEEIKPAHMTVEYEFSYLLIRDIDGIMTLDEIEQVPLLKFAGGDPVG